MGRKDISSCERWFRTNRRGINQLIVCFSIFLCFVYFFTPSIEYTETDENLGTLHTEHSSFHGKPVPSAIDDDLGIIGNSRIVEPSTRTDTESNIDSFLEAEDKTAKETRDDDIIETEQEPEPLTEADGVMALDSTEQTEKTEETFNEMQEELTVESGEATTYWPLPARIAPKNPNVFVNFRTKACSYFCSLIKDEGLRESQNNPYRMPPEFLFIDYRKYTKYSSLKRTIINQVGRGSSCIGGGKGKQLRCREELAENAGCKFEDLSVQPPSWNIQSIQTCKEFYAIAKKPEHKNTIWIAKPGGSFHGRGITIHDSVNSLQKKFGTCTKTLSDGVIIQEYVKDPATIGGHKFDLRSYLLIASTDPFIVFYHDGFIRRAENKYSTDSSSLKDPLAHVTNAMGQSSENHFFSFEQLQEVLSREHGFKSDFMSNTFRTNAMRVTNFLFNSAYNRTRGLIPTPGRFQLFALDWMIDRKGGLYLLEANGNPLIAHYENIGLTPDLWTSLIQLEKLLHTSPEKLNSPLSVAQGFSYKGWKLVYNQVEVEAEGENFDACKYDEYIKSRHPLYSYQNFAEDSY
mmetsp:Transcript_11741/g.13625  ORF Transcript_11741/g.13625 Transcript_11741/m.13625 type:complete len:575 (+) Transcript_11741:149-1873(+)|eukprot:CAMPEP_0184007458 /NCGR_PEP_ID=MMETSP0954-20121128/1342_1 /TAXON_ID=627963 /ORGANISM="Aplanochytrium sp, Strain PBS07" /LENGTH=574 /DNA_ID=CAMNT_0026286285 /DNA_START=65 /DNA_END=1789 /DNA_ORIENTATION=-